MQTAPDQERKLWLVAILIPLLFIFSYPARNLFFFSPDSTNLFYVVKRWFWNHVARGEFPLWNEGLYGGLYQLASPAHEIFSPLTAPFYWILPGYWPLIASLALSAALAGFGMFKLATKFRLIPMFALTLSIGYSLSGCLLGLIDRSPIFTGVALYPLLVLAIWNLLERHTWGRITLTACLWALLIHHGDWVGAAVFAIAMLIAGYCVGRMRAVMAVAVSLALGLALAAIVILPTRENLAFTERGQGFTFTEASRWSFHPLRILQILIPELWGEVYSFSFYGQQIADQILLSRFWYHSLHLGAIMVAFAALGVWACRRTRGLYLVSTAALICMLIAMGNRFYLHGFLFEYLPGYSRLRYPEKFILYPVLMLFWAALIGARKLQSESSWWSRLWLYIAGLELGAMAIARGFAPLEMTAGQSAFVQQNFIFHFVLVALAGGLSIWNRKCSQPWSFAVFIFVELVVFSPTQARFPSEFFAAPPAELESTVKDIVRSGGRLLRDPKIFPDNSTFRTDLAPNWGILMGLNYVQGYETIPPERAQLATRAELFGKLDVWSTILNVQAVLTPLSPRDPDLKVWAERGLLKPVYVNKEANYAILKKVQAESTTYSIVRRAVSVSSSEEAFQKVRERKGLSPIYVEGVAQFAADPSVDSVTSPEVRILKKTTNMRELEVNVENEAYLSIRETNPRFGMLK